MSSHTRQPRPTRASQDLKARFAANRGMQMRMAKQTGIRQARLSLIASGLIVPRGDETPLIEKAGGPPAAWWAEPITASAEASGAT